MMRETLLKTWYQRKLTYLSLILYPLSWLFAACVITRRFLYDCGWFKAVTLPVPVIVVGNIVVGGTGKTPTVIALARYLSDAGYRVGVMSRGVGSASLTSPLLVTASTETQQAGDEAVLIAKRTGLPVVVFPDRIAAGRYLIESQHCHVIIADDGLQHYRLKPSFTIALVDAKRGYGNECLLPAGPLREPMTRLSSYDAVLTTSRESGDILIQPEAWCHLLMDTKEALSTFSNKPAHVIASIAHPASFFATTQTLGISGHYHAFPDHHAYRLQDLHFQPKLPIVMTEKDAVKCKAFALNDSWYLTETAQLPDTLKQALIVKLKGART